MGEQDDVEEGFDAGEWNNLPWPSDYIECAVCKGSGFSGRGTGYDDVCGECGGLKYLPQPDRHVGGSPKP